MDMPSRTHDVYDPQVFRSSGSQSQLPPSATESLSSANFPASFRPIIPTTFPCSPSYDTSFQSLINPSSGGARFNRLNGAFTKTDNGIAKDEVIFLLSSGLIVPAGLTDADGGVVSAYRFSTRVVMVTRGGSPAGSGSGKMGPDAMCVFAALGLAIVVIGYRVRKYFFFEIISEQHIF